MRSESGEVHRQSRRCSLFCFALAGFSLLASRRWDCRCNIIFYKVLSNRAGPIYSRVHCARNNLYFIPVASKSRSVNGVLAFGKGRGKFGLDRFERRLQAAVDGHEFETLNLFSGQYEGREMKGIESWQ
jgi:hypothetical protein